MNRRLVHYNTTLKLASPATWCITDMQVNEPMLLHALLFHLPS